MLITTRRAFMVLGPLAVAACGAVALGQVHEPGPVDLPPGTAIDEAGKAYRAGPVADDVSITVRTGAAGPERKERYRVRIAARSADGQQGPRLLLERGRLRVFGAPGKRVAADVGDETACVVWELEGDPTAEDLARHLPPVPLPQIALALGGENAARDLTPYTLGTVWSTATADERVTPSVVMLKGRCSGGDVTMVIDGRQGKSGRLRSFVAELKTDPGGAGRGMTLDLKCEPVVNPGDPKEWEIDPGTREHLGSISELRQRPAPIAVGKRVPVLRLLSGQGEEWEGSWPAVQPDVGPPAPGIGAVVLVFFRVPGDVERAAGISRDAMAGVEAAVAWFNLPAGPAGIAVRRVAVFRPMDFKPDRLAALGNVRSPNQLSGSTGPDSLLQTPLNFTISPPATLDRFAAGADAALVLLDASKVLRAVIRLDGRADQSDAIAAELRDIPPAPAAE
jgi:hypothetical protein